MSSRDAVAGMLLVVLGVALYLPSLGHELLRTYDDTLTVVDGADLHDLTADAGSKLQTMFDPTLDRRQQGLSAEYLPVRDLSFAWDHLWWARSDEGDELALRPGRQAMVGGGRAVLGFVAPEKKKGKGPQIQIRCAAEKRILELAEDAQTEEVCGIRVRSLGPVDPRNARYGGTRFEVSWE